MALRAAMGSRKTQSIDVRGRESDCRIVPAKLLNKGQKEADTRIMADLNGHEGGNAGDSQGKPTASSEGRRTSAEGVEGRRQAEGNAGPQNTLRTQSREGMSSARDRIRQAARSDRRRRFTALLHHVYDIEALREAYFGLKRDAAAGVDGETWRTYGEQLEGHLVELSECLRRGAYRAKPVRRVLIPKPDGGQRPLGVTTLEDKLVQRALVMVLNCIYEEDFVGFSYGFRPERGPHDALDALYVGIKRMKVNWVLDADIRGYFDAISHEWLVKFIEHRIADRRVVRLIQKWLNAGVLEDGEWRPSEMGTPQGGGISPLLANVYLHYVFDLWARAWRRHAKGDVIIVRYADDIIVGFQYEWEARRFWNELRDRFAAFGLELHPEKTRLIEFGRYAAENRKRNGRGKPETFDFLGFTHMCGKTRKGRFALVRQTVRKRLRTKLREVKETFRWRWHEPIPEVGRWLASILRGHYGYYAVPLNSPALQAFYRQVVWMWKRGLSRRSHKAYITWQRMWRIVQRWLPPPRIVHLWPDERLCLPTQGGSLVR
jgi:RNA-directed DNA polymerase